MLNTPCPIVPAVFKFIDERIMYSCYLLTTSLNWSLFWSAASHTALASGTSHSTVAPTSSVMPRAQPGTFIRRGLKHMHFCHKSSSSTNSERCRRICENIVSHSGHPLHRSRLRRSLLPLCSAAANVGPVVETAAAAAAPCYAKPSNVAMTPLLPWRPGDRTLDAPGQLYSHASHESIGGTTY